MKVYQFLLSVLLMVGMVVLVAVSETGDLNLEQLNDGRLLIVGSEEVITNFQY